MSTRTEEKGAPKNTEQEQYEPQRAQLHLQNNSFAVFPCYVTMFFALDTAINDND